MEYRGNNDPIQWAKAPIQLRVLERLEHPEHHPKDRPGLCGNAEHNQQWDINTQVVHDTFDDVPAILRQRGQFLRSVVHTVENPEAPVRVLNPVHPIIDEVAKDPENRQLDPDRELYRSIDTEKPETGLKRVEEGTPQNPVDARSVKHGVCDVVTKGPRPKTGQPFPTACLKDENEERYHRKIGDSTPDRRPCQFSQTKPFDDRLKLCGWNGHLRHLARLESCGHKSTGDVPGVNPHGGRYILGRPPGNGQ